MAECLLIGLIVGIERESDKEERHAGLRDFISIGLAGGLCGLLSLPWLTASALLCLTAMLVIFRLQNPQRTGITTELASVVTFLLCVLASTPGFTLGAPLAIALTVVLALFLDAREPLRRLARETLSDQEYWDTLRFLAVIFVVLPILPNDDYGPFAAFNPYRTWVFVILVSGINFLGYFFQKFLGARRSLALTAIAGGIGSSTASTIAFARQTAADPARARDWAFAAVLANVILNLRVAAILWLAGGALLAAALPVLLLMAGSGGVYAWLLRPGASTA
ncbi:MAG: MgtC/SapB family protein, partial [Bryobacteraceae bacterium]